MEFNLNRFLKNSLWFMEWCIIIISVEHIISIKCNTGNSSIREELDVDGMINCDFLIFKNRKHCITELIRLLSGRFCSLNSIHAFKTKWNVILIEKNIGVIKFQTSTYNMVVDWHTIIHEWENFYSGINYRHPKSWQWFYAQPW